MIMDVWDHVGPRGIPEGQTYLLSIYNDDEFFIPDNLVRLVGVFECLEGALHALEHMRRYSDDVGAVQSLATPPPSLHLTTSAPSSSQLSSPSPCCRKLYSLPPITSTSRPTCHLAATSHSGCRPVLATKPRASSGPVKCAHHPGPGSLNR